jgi:hypothetical protein
VRQRAPTLRRRRRSRAKKPPKSAKKAAGARDGSKTSKVLDLLRRPGGVTAKVVMKATGWQPHSVRGFLSGTIGKKMGLTVTSAKGEDGERSYSVKPDPRTPSHRAAGHLLGGVSRLYVLSAVRFIVGRGARFGLILPNTLFAGCACSVGTSPDGSHG